MRVLTFLLMAVVFMYSIVGCGCQKVREASARRFNNVAQNLSTDGSESAPTADWEATTPAAKSASKMAAAAKDKAAGGAKLGEADAIIRHGADAAGPVAAPTPPAAVADAITGTEKRGKKTPEPALPAGVLTAGSFDDNIDPRAFLAFLKRMSQLRGLQDIPPRMSGQRLFIQVKDGAGKPVGGAKVQLVATTGQAAELITRTDGRAVFLSSFDELPGDVALTATVIPPDGGAAVTEKIDAGAPRWEITLPAATAKLPRNLDLAIVLDTTGSMGDELEYIKSEIRGISKAVHDKFPEVQQRFALVVYRDEGDEYVARHFDFASLEVFHKRLAEQKAAGGGDYPEAVHKGFEEAHQLRWRNGDTARVLFWIADAPPHAQHMNRTMNAINVLRKQGVAMYPIACSGYDDACEVVMRSCALLTGSQFLFLTDDSGVGNSHAEPKIPYYQVERLEKLMIRMIAGELAGQRIDAIPAEVIRTVGRKVN
jgi:hypothetical protein